MRNLIAKFMKSEEGVAAAEYAIFMAIISSALATAALYLSGAIGDSMNTAANVIAQG